MFWWRFINVFPSSGRYGLSYCSYRQVVRGRYAVCSTRVPVHCSSLCSMSYTFGWLSSLLTALVKVLLLRFSGRAAPLWLPGIGSVSWVPHRGFRLWICHVLSFYRLCFWLISLLDCAYEILPRPLSVPCVSSLPHNLPG